MTIADVHLVTGLGRSTICECEGGKYSEIGVIRLQLLAKALGSDLPTILGAGRGRAAR